MYLFNKRIKSVMNTQFALEVIGAGLQLRTYKYLDDDLGATVLYVIK